MANIEDLIAHIADDRLRKAIVAEVRALKRTKRFGLVFEEHLPETVRVPSLAITVGSRVAPKTEQTDERWRVVAIRKNVATCERTLSPSEIEKKDFRLDELVVVRSFGEPIYPSLTPVDRVERGGVDKPWHVLINADNFHALQLLLYAYEGTVDAIYIDPPYNSGARDWKYNNDYVDRADTFRHSKWLSMMRKRLVLAKKLLRRDGVLIVTIDENEIYHLGMLLEEIFNGYLRHQLTIVINPKGTGKLNFARTDEYALFCVPNTGEPLVRGNSIPDLTAASDEEDASIDDEDGTGDEEAADDADVDANAAQPEQTGPFPPEEADMWELRHARRRGNESSYRHQRPNQFYAIWVDESTKEVVEIDDSLPEGSEPTFKKRRGLTPVWPIDKEGHHRCWRLIPDSMRALLAEGRVIVGRQDKTTRSWTLNLWYRKTSVKRVKTVWWNTRHDAGTHGTTLLHKILGKRDAFPFPKSVYAVRDTLKTVVEDRPDALILDFFAGSGTTAHAVAMINAELGGRRRSILVSNNEPGEKKARQLQKHGLFPGDDEYEAAGICDSVTWPRCKYVVNGKRDDGTTLNGKYLSTNLDGTTRRLEDGFEENIEYFRLDFIDPAAVARGDAFQAILPVLWMMAGSRGARESSKGSQAWFIPKHSPYAVLITEKEFRAFKEKVSERSDIQWLFLVTDSEENFAAMRRMLGRRYTCVQLYKSYLDNFRLNVDPSLTTHTTDES